MEYEVTAIQRPDRYGGHEAIVAIGNNREGWSVSVESAVKRIAAKREYFYVEDALQHKKVYLYVFRTPSGQDTVRAAAAGRWTDHLLALDSLRDAALID